eukprot:CAMPEP_0184500152 /NCGR_PEP_ID=MMETSP0113_2-20130426/43829_1 /TAXON_ID=91329 /ORGANISM="Norrisiella sphaerica, Strain BC52" /LENGTH=40 /DNA_ID= /DNA_START= /DNA_END= /DNA_ORIENTATION=
MAWNLRDLYASKTPILSENAFESDIFPRRIAWGIRSLMFV